jgi:hypothetical protein
MSEALHIWIQQASAQPGVMACGVRCADRSIIARSNHETVPIPRIQQALREMWEAVHALQHNHIATDRLRWKFENGKVCAAAKPDGTLAALLINQETEDLTECEVLLADFLNLKL